MPVVTELFNNAVDYFDAKNLTCFSRILVVTEHSASHTFLKIFRHVLIRVITVKGRTGLRGTKGTPRNIRVHLLHMLLA